jgi:hypothetical protein
VISGLWLVEKPRCQCFGSSPVVCHPDRGLQSERRDLRFVVTRVEMLIFGRIVAVLVGLILLVNGAFMLVSPRAWFRLPYYLRATGTATEKRFESGLGEVQTRLAGGVMVAGILWVVFDLCSRR